MTALSPARRAHIRSAAEALLVGHGTGGTGFALLKHVCEQEGIALFDADLRDIAGALRREGEHWRMYLNREDAPSRRRFTLAHALGHYALHADGRRAFVESRFALSLAAGADDGMEEREANAFAACLVMPAGVIDAVLAGLQPTAQQVHALADRFAVSPLAMAHRLGDLGYTVPFLQSRRQPALRDLRSPAGAFAASAWTGVR